MVWSLFGAGCASNGQSTDEFSSPGETGLLVDEFEISGVNAFPVRKLKRGLTTRKDPGWRTKVPLIGAERGYFNQLDWKKDLQRIRTYYYSRGYYNMQIVRENIDRDYEEGTVQLFLKVSEGERVEVKSIDIEGLQAVDSYDSAGLLEGLPLEEGRPFSERGYINTKSAMLERLERAGYAYADLAGRAYVYPDRSEAQIRFIADPGPKAVFGDIEVKGLETVPEPFVRQVIRFDPGDPYSSQVVQETQQSIYGLDVFSLVNVSPAHEAGDDPRDAEDDIVAGDNPTLRPTGSGDEVDPGTGGISGLLDAAQKTAERRNKLSPRVPMVVRVKEARMWDVRVGAGVAAESNRQDAHGQVDVSSKNFLGGLRKLRWRNTAGFAWAPGLLLADDDRASRSGLILESELEFVQPWIRQKETNFRVEPSITRDVQVGYTLWNPSARLGVDRRIWENFTVGLGYRVSFFNFQNVDRQLASETPLGEDFQPKFLLEFLEQSFTIDYRDDPLDPTRGWVADVTAQEATSYLFGGEFDYVKAFGSLRGYIPFHLATKWVLALKWRGGVIYNLEPPNSSDGETTTQRVPTTSRFDGGGTGSMRSFGRQQLSVFKGTVPVGGLTQMELSVEPRFRLVSDLLEVGDFWAATFLDAGTVLPGQFLVETPANRSLTLGTEGPSEIVSSLLYGVGLGIWWVTPIGPVRADFAYTLNDFQVRQCRNQELVITGNSDCVPLESADNPLQNKLTGFNFIIGIGHSF